MTLSELMRAVYGFSDKRSLTGSKLPKSVYTEAEKAFKAAAARNGLAISDDFFANFIQLVGGSDGSVNPSDDQLKRKYPDIQADFILAIEGVMKNKWKNNSSKSERFQNMRMTLKAALSDDDVRNQYMMKKFFKDVNGNDDANAGVDDWAAVFAVGNDNNLAEPFHSVRTLYIQERGNLNNVNVLALPGADKRAKVQALLEHDGGGDNAAKQKLNQLGMKLLEVYYKEKFADNNDILHDYLNAAPIPAQAMKDAVKNLKSFLKKYNKEDTVASMIGYDQGNNDLKQAFQTLSNLDDNNPDENAAKGALKTLIGKLSLKKQQRKASYDNWFTYSGKADKAVDEIMDLCRKTPKICEWAKDSLNNNEDLANAVRLKFKNEFSEYDRLTHRRSSMHFAGQDDENSAEDTLAKRLKTDANNVANILDHLIEEYGTFAEGGTNVAHVNGEYRSVLQHTLKSFAPIIDDATYAKYMATHFQVELTRYRQDSWSKKNASKGKKVWSQKVITELSAIKADMAANNLTGSQAIEKMATLMSEHSTLVDRADVSAVGSFLGTHKVLGTQNLKKVFDNALKDLEPRMTEQTKQQVADRKSFADKQIKSGKQRPSDAVDMRITK